MTSIQVREMLGEPAYISTSNTNTIYGYTYNMPIRNKSALFEWEQERLLSSQSLVFIQIKDLSRSSFLMIN